MNSQDSHPFRFTPLSVDQTSKVVCYPGIFIHHAHTISHVLASRRNRSIDSRCYIAQCRGRLQGATNAPWGFFVLRQQQGLQVRGSELLVKHRVDGSWLCVPTAIQRAACGGYRGAGQCQCSVRCSGRGAHGDSGGFLIFKLLMVIA